MRIGFSIVFALLIAVLLFCAIKSFHSHKKIGKSVGLLDLSLIPPVIGNLIIIISSAHSFSMAGYYIYFIGMALVMLASVRFAAEYCGIIGKRYRPHIVMYTALILDIVQILLNLFFGHAFDIEAIEVQGAPYYRITPLWGLMLHRVIVYSVFLSVILIFLLATIRAAKIYRERFSIVLLAMLLIGVWQSFYIISRTPVDRSMLGYGVFGILVFYLSLHYRPLRLLDGMLSSIAADMPEALFVYDPSGKVIWANETGLKLLDLNKDDLEKVS